MDVGARISSLEDGTFVLKSAAALGLAAGIPNTARTGRVMADNYGHADE